MGKLLMSSVRPSDIKMGTTDVNEVYCDGVLVWKRKSTFEKNHGTNYLYASRTIIWTANDTSTETVVYLPNSPAKTTSTFDIDLTSIPSEATIISAQLTWNYAFHVNLSTPSSWWSTTTTAVYFVNTNSAKVSSQILDCTNDIIPGTINTLTLSYQQAGNKFSTANSGSTIKRTRTCTLENITITVNYQV